MQGALFDAVALWELTPTTGAAAVINSATEALLRGLDSASLRELAGASTTESHWALRPMIQTTLRELGIDYPGPTPDDVAVAATRVMCRRALGGGIAPRELVVWAHQTIGHQGASRLQALVEMDDVYDEIDRIGPTVESLDKEVLAEARSIVEGRPLDERRSYDGRMGAQEPRQHRSVAGGSPIHLWQALGSGVQRLRSYLRR